MVARTAYRHQGNLASEDPAHTEQHTCEAARKAALPVGCSFFMTPESQREDGMLDKYSGRSEYATPMNLSLDRDAVEYLRSIAGAKNIGRVISSLILQERARREERAKIVRELQAGIPVVRG